MVKVNFSPSDFRRKVADAESLILRNRYFEQNPFLTDDGAALLARPGMRYLATVGTGPIRGVFSEPGTFDGDLFVASGDSIYRVDKNMTSTLIRGNLNNPERGVVNMTITGNINNVPEMLFFADGANLFVYIGDGYSTNNLVGVPANGDVVRIGDMYYQFTTGSVDAGTPAGTLANPWLIDMLANPAIGMTNIGLALDDNGIPGADYSTGLEANPSAQMQDSSTDTVVVRARVSGIIGNSVITTETGTALAWSDGGTLTGGGDPQSFVVPMPDDVGAIDVATIASFVIVVPAQGEGINGRFYWIEPGETEVNPLNFATAERSPDPIFGVLVVGDQFLLPGESTTEAWYVTGDPTAPMQRLQGVVFDRGTWESTAVAINEKIIVCDADGAVFSIGGGAPQRISTPDIEETIRRAIQYQQSRTL